MGHYTSLIYLILEISYRKRCCEMFRGRSERQRAVGPSESERRAYPNDFCRQVP